MALTKPFAANGDKTPIKLDTTADGVVNYENGFGARYSMPIKAVIDSSGNITKTGGLQIERGQMNQILNDFSSAIIENQENIGGLSSLQTTAKDNLVGAINEVNANTPKLLTSNLEWSVGTGGDYTTLQAALEEASRLSPIFINNGIKLVLKLKTGFNWNFKLIIKNVNLNFVELQSEDSLINIASSVFNGGGILISFENCFPFTINASFRLASAVSGSTFARYFNCAKAVVSPNLTFDGFDIAFGIIQSNSSIPSATISNNRLYGVNIASSICNLSGSIFNNNGIAIYNTGGSTTYMYRGEINNSTTNSVTCTNGFVGFFQSKISQTSGTHCNVDGGGVISLVRTTPTGGADYSQAINTLTGKGIIYKS